MTYREIEKSTVLTQYIRHPHNHNQLVGCVVGICWNGEVRVGWSQCNPLDRFDKKLARRIALDRAWMGTNVNPCPYKAYTPSGKVIKLHQVEAYIATMQLRAERYFKKHPEQGAVRQPIQETILVICPASVEDLAFRKAAAADVAILDESLVEEALKRR